MQIMDQIAKIFAKQSILSKYRYLNHGYKQGLFSNSYSRINATSIANFARSVVPYYSDTFANHSAPITLEAFDELPYLTKSQLIKSNKYLIDPVRPRLFYSYTNGTFGGRAKVALDDESSNYSAAVMLKCRALAGHGLWQRQVHLASGSQHQSSTLHNEIRDLVNLRKSVYINNFANESLHQAISEITRQRPHLLSGLPSTLLALSKIASQSDFTSIKFVECTGEPLESMVRAQIASYFSCSVLNRYGLAEAGIVAYQMQPDSDWLEVLHPHVYIEIGADNEIILTTLNNYVMPLIRYRTGDYCNEWKIEGDRLYIRGIEGRRHINVKVAFGIELSTSVLEDYIFKIPEILNIQFILDSKGTLRNILVDPGDAETHVRSCFVHSLPVANQIGIGSILPLIAYCPVSEFNKIGLQSKVPRIFKHPA